MQLLNWCVTVLTYWQLVSARCRPHIVKRDNLQPLYRVLEVSVGLMICCAYNFCTSPKNGMECNLFVLTWVWCAALR